MKKWDKRFMQMAKLVSTWSKDPSRQVGAVITKDKKQISLGYNGFPKGVKDNKERYLDKELKYSLVVHAEVNAILNTNTSVKGATMYVYSLPVCNECAKVIVQAGIKRIVLHKEFKHIKDKNCKWNKAFQISLLMFDEADVKVDYI